MPELGNKHECYSCGTKFYDLGKSEALCPKCGANQKDAKQAVPSTEAAALRRRRRDDLQRDNQDEETAVAPSRGSRDGDEADDEAVEAPEETDAEADGDKGNEDRTEDAE